MRTVSNGRKEKKNVLRRGKTYLTTITSFLVEFQQSYHKKFHLKSAIKLVDWISKLNSLPLGQELSQFRPLLQAEVVSNKVSVDAILPPLLGVVQDVWGCVTTMDKHFKSKLPACASWKTIRRASAFVTHPPLSSAHTSSWQWIFSRTSEWSWQKCQTFSPSSPPAGKATEQPVWQRSVHLWLTFNSFGMQQFPVYLNGSFNNILLLPFSGSLLKLFF